MAQPAQAVDAVGGELVIIESVHVGNPVFSTYDSCSGWLHHADPVVPLTIGASFLTPNGDGPTGPYATGTWSGGYGSSDDHFATGQAHSPFQTFHILMSASDLAGYHGPGHYTVTALVQDVGLAGGIASKTVGIDLPGPAPTTAKVKCDIQQPLEPVQQIQDMAWSAIKKVAATVCEQCDDASSALDAISAAWYYTQLSEHYARGIVEKDPPDYDFQHLMQPSPPPVIAAPSALPSDQQAAITQAYQQEAAVIGELRAIYTTLDRVWGADNTGSQYWYQRQIAHLADLAGTAATDFNALPARWSALQAALTPDLPSTSVSEQDSLDALAPLAGRVPSDMSAALTQLGEPVSTGNEIVDDMLAVDPATLVGADGVAAMFGQDDAGLAESMGVLAKWAGTIAGEQPPVVTNVGPDHVPNLGGDLVTVSGINMASVTGVNFGPSTPAGGQGTIADCTANQCEVYAPPGSGTVDVVAVGPGGPSQINSDDQVTYSSPGVPQVSRIFPASGPQSGDTQVTVFGAQLAGGVVYFGPTAADSWQCDDTSCTAYSAQAANSGTVDVTVVTPGGTSAIGAADQFTYLANTPPPPPAPQVTGVSPDNGSDQGGETLTISGSHFTGASTVEFGGSSIFGRALTVVDDSHIQLTAPAGNPGDVTDVQVLGPGGASAISAADHYSYHQMTAPVITAVSPASGPDIGGTKVTVTGHDLYTGSVYFGGNYAGDSICTPTQCTATAPPHADGTVDITVGTYDGESAPVSADHYSYTAGPAPQISSVSPDSGTTFGGTAVVIHGTDLNGGSVSIGGQPAGALGDTACTMTSCVVTVPAGTAGQANVVVTTVAGASAPMTYTYVTPAKPVITAMSPNIGWLAGDTSVDIYGSNLTNGTVMFGGTAAWSSTCSQSMCTATSPGAAVPGPVHVSISTSGGTSAATSADLFTYIQPTVTGVSPNSGWTAGGTKVTITGTNLAGGSVQFGSGDGSVAAGTCGPNSCTVTAPVHAAAGTVDVTVQSPFITTSPVTPADQFTYSGRPTPTVTGVSPNHGTHDGGDQVTVTGTNLDGATIKFGTVAAPAPCGTDTTTCTVAVPSHADGTVDVTAITPAGTSAISSVDQFSYQAPGVPTVTDLSPTGGTAAGGTLVTVTGTNLLHASITFGGSNATSVTCEQSSCTGTAPAHAIGVVDVVVHTSGGNSAAGMQYTYAMPPAPTITGVFPASGPASGAVPVTLTGSDLTGATINFGPNAATNVNCLTTSCTVIVPPGSAGTVDVTATTVGGTSTASAADQFGYEPVSLSERAISGVTTGTGGGAIVRGIGGDLWFTLPNQDQVGRVGSGGDITTYPVEAGGNPQGITLGTDGQMWVSERKLDRLVSLNASGVLMGTYPLPGVTDGLRFVTAGPDGRLWFTLYGAGAIGAMTTSGTVTVYHLPDPTVGPYNILPGPDGRMWFTEVAGSAIGAITTSGQVHEYPVPDPDTDPQGIALGADGRMWFTDPDNDHVSALDPATGDITDYPLPVHAGNEGPRYLAMDSAGSLWGTENLGARLLKIDGIASAAVPTLTDVSPAYGAAGSTVVITGTNLAGTSAVSFGGAAAGSFSVIDPAHVQATVPAGSGTVSVHVTTPNGTSPAATAEFTYGAPPAPTPVVAGVSPASGPAAGGTTVTISGSGLAGGAVRFGDASATSVTCGAEACTATSPAGAAGTLDVTVTTTGGTSTTSSADAFTYLDPNPPQPTVTGVSPASGSPLGGTAVTVAGTNLDGGQLLFGLDAATAVSCTATSCTATAPAGPVGAVDVRVETAGGTSAVGAADRFTYTAPTKSASTTLVSASPGAPALGDLVTYTVTVTGPGPDAPTGTATVKAGGTTLCTTGTLADNQASCTSVKTPAGSDTITATYPGDIEYTGSSGTTTLTVAKGTPSATVSVTPQTVAHGTRATFTAHLSPPSGVSTWPTGAVTLKTGSTALCTATLLLGSGTCTSTSAPVGTDTITAAYSGDTQYRAVQATTTLKVTVAADKTAPAPKITAPSTLFQLGSNITIRYAATDTDSPAGIKYDLQYRKAKWNAGFGPYISLAAGATTASRVLTGSAGYEYCFRVRARDTAGNLSSWTADKCTVLPLDDRSLTAATSGWKRSTSSGSYHGTITKSSHLGARLRLSGAAADRLALVVTTCSACGKVGIYLGRTLWKTVSTYSATTRKRVIIIPARFRIRIVTITLRVATSGKPVIIDGLGIARN